MTNNIRNRPGRPPLNRPEPEAAREIREPRPIMVEEELIVEAVEEPAIAAAPPLREPPREEDPRARLARRTAELRDVASTITDVSDEFYVPVEVIPDGWTYEWKTAQVYGQDQQSRMLEFRRTGWEEVPTRRHPEMMPLGTSEPFIIRKGMILMERPAVITQEFEYRQKRDAFNQVKQKEAEAKGGEAYTNSDKGFENRSGGIKHGWDRGPVLPSATQLEVPDY